jgi:type I restriction enzyme R subunit
VSNLNENTLTEQPVIEWLKELGYEYAFGPKISPGGERPERKDYKQVVLKGRLRQALERLNPHLPPQAIDQAEEKILKISHPNLEIANDIFYQMLKGGVKVKVKRSNGEIRGDFARIIDFKNPQNNDFLVANQFSVEGTDSVRRPDIVVFINGLPLAVFELKNPTTEEATVYTAFRQIQQYK